MPLGQNPFFEKVMQTVDMIADDNRQIKAEERQEERQIQYEQRQEERFQKRQEVERKNKLFGDLNSAIQESQRNIQASGVNENPGLLNSLIQRRNELLQDPDITPIVSGGVTQGPPKEMKQEAKMVNLDPDVAKWAKMDPNTPVTEVTARVLGAQYRDYFKPDKTGGGKGGKKEPDLRSDPVGYINNLLKGAKSRFDKGVFDPEIGQKLGIDESTYNSFIQNLERLRDKYERQNNKLNPGDEEELIQLQDFDVYMGDVKGNKSKVNALGDKILETLNAAFELPEK